MGKTLAKSKENTNFEIEIFKEEIKCERERKGDL